MSIDAGLPSAWEVEQQLILEVAAQRDLDLDHYAPARLGDVILVGECRVPAALVERSGDAEFGERVSL